MLKAPKPLPQDFYIGTGIAGNMIETPSLAVIGINLLAM